MTKRLKLITIFACFFILNFSSAREVLHDNLPPLDNKVYEYSYHRPHLFGEQSRNVLVRRSKINLEGVQNSLITFNVLSGTGSSIFLGEAYNLEKARRSLEETTFQSVSGKVREDLSGIEFPASDRKDLSVNFPQAHALAHASADIYLKLPLAAQAFANSGYTEQHYVVASKSENEAVVLKNDKVIVVAARGTEPTSVTNWIGNAKFFQVPVLKGASPKAHLGFAQAAADLYPIIRSHIVSTLENKIRKIISKIKKTSGGTARLASYGILDNVQEPDLRPIYFTGHSLGGAAMSLVYGELTLNWLDTSNLGYYFVDPVLSKIPDENINKLIQDTIEEEQFFDADIAQTFSFNEQHDFPLAGKLTHLATIQSEASYSQTPVESIDGVTVDNRLKALITFGAPRSMDWLFKYTTEKYAGASGSKIIRFENHHLNSGTDREGLLLGDLVPRVPLSAFNIAGDITIGPEYTHLGFRGSFETDSPDTGGNPEAIRCVYTDKENENALNSRVEFQLSNSKISFTYHKIGLYLSRISGYAKASPLPPEHSCNNLVYKMPEAK